MKSRYLTILVTFLVFILLGTVLLKMPQFAATSRSNEPIPYIYYYSDLHHAWVIERADGSDSRLLAQGVMPSETYGISSASWSPSGEWLAWTSYRWSEGGSSAKIGWMVSSDGSQVSHLLDDAQDVFLMDWAADKDWLLVGFNSSSWLDNQQVIRIIDVPNQRIVAELRQNGLHDIENRDYRERYGNGWSEDNNSVYFFDNSVITRLQTNGIVEIWYSSMYSRIYDFNHERLLSGETRIVDDSYQWNYVITDLSTNEEYIFIPSLINEGIEYPDYDLEWNADRSYALITEKACENAFDHYCDTRGLYLLDWVNKRQYSLDAKFEIPYDENYDNNYLPYPLWSPNGEVSILRDNNGQFYLLDVNTRDVYSIEVNDILVWHWLSNDDLMFGASGQDSHILYYYQWATKSLSEHPNNTNLSFWDIELSPDGNFIGYLMGQDVVVENRTTREFYTYPPHSYTTAGGPVFGYHWGNNPEWFFSGGNTQLTDSCCTSRAIMIHNLHQATGRELTLCNGVDTCAGFLPDNVLPHLRRGQAQSLTPAPEQILLHDKTMRGLAWNSDGSRLATFAFDWDEGSTISIWNMQDEAAYLEESFAIEQRCENHPGSCSMRWFDENQIAIFDGSIINIRTGARNQSEQERASSYYPLSSDGRYELVFSGENQEISHLRDVETEQLISENPLENLNQYTLYQFDYHPETGLLVGSNVYDRGGLWDVATGEKIATLNWTGYAAVFSPDGRRLAVASSEFVSIWDMSEYVDNR
jgi:hypothetical protein